MSNSDLFNEKTLKRLSSNFQISQKQKNASNEWLEFLEEDVTKKEKRNYLKFNRIIITELLGYPDLEHEVENVEFSYNKNGKILLKIEVKGTDTKDLFQKQSRVNPESPVDQIWRYMNKHATAYGIVTNYEKFILFKYEVGRAKHQEFDFYSIKENPEKLKEFIALFSRESIDNNFVEKLYNESLNEEREFTSEFYKLFHETRLMLIKEFQRNNVNKEESIHFAQLFLNRLMFIFFAKDTGKLPADILDKRIVKELDNIESFSSNSKKISDAISNLFYDLDKGSEFPVEIYAFNGGLFKVQISPSIYFNDLREERFFYDVIQHSKLKKDLKLNSTQLALFNKYKNKLSPIIKNILLMASFDFKSEISVIILGHIFEQSLNDLEELEGNELSKRKKEGIYYTPEYITDYICRNTIIPSLSNKNNNDISELILEYKDNINELENKFRNIKILDLACGSGAFLLKTVDILLEVHKEIRLLKQLEGKYFAKDFKKSKKDKNNDKSLFTLKKWYEEEEARQIIENNIFGVDLNDESVEITKLSLFLKIAEKGKKLLDLSKNIRQGNSLINSKETDERAFDWEINFPFKFNVVIGNPPYVRADVDDQSYQKQRKWILKNDQDMILYEKWDLYLAFIKKGLDLLAENGNLGMIIPDAFSTAKYASRMRQFLCNNKQVIQLDYFPYTNIFKGVGVKNIILTIQNTKQNKDTIKIIHSDLTKIQKRTVINLKESGENGFRINYVASNILNYGTTELLGDICFISKGMVLNSDEKEFKGEFKKDDLISDIADDTHRTRYIEAKNVQRYLIREIRYLEWNTNRVPSKISRKTFPELYKGEKIIRGRMTDATFDDSGLLNNDSLYDIKKFCDIKEVDNRSINNSISKWSNKNRKEMEIISQDFELKYLLAIINSKWAKNYLKGINRSSLSFYPDDLKKLPIKKISLKEQNKFVEMVDRLLALNDKSYKIKQKFLNRIQKEFNITKFNRKLEAFFTYGFIDFSNEIERLTKGKLSLDVQDEWEDYFNRYKEELVELNNNIRDLDENIDKTIYQVYRTIK